MTILQPVTTKSPSNRKVLEESGLPFGFVITPFADRSAVSQGDDDAFHQRRKAKLAKTNTGRKMPASASPYASAFPTKASLIPKCTECGSPLNPTCQFLDHWYILCNLCGSVYDADFDTQVQTRILANASHGSAEDKYDLSNDEYVSKQEAEYKRRYGQGSTREECSEPLAEYSLPLLSIQNPAMPDKLPRKDVYALPAKLCPPLLTIFIDGTSSDTNYYERISSYLHQLICNDNEDEGSNIDKNGEYKRITKVGIFVMTKNGGLSAFDLSNPGGHLQHLWVDSSPLKVNPKFSSGSGNGRSRNEPSNAAGQEDEDYNVASLAQIMTPEQIFVPLDDYGKSCVQNAIRALEDSTIAIQQACQRSDSGGNDCGGAYLGSTLQYFLEFMRNVAYHPGQMHDGMDDFDEFFDIQEDPIDVEDKFLYAGGKIMCFLSGAPDEIGDAVAASGAGVSTGGRNKHVGAGGFGGSCAEVGKRFSASSESGLGNGSPSDNSHHDNVDDLEAGGVKQTSNLAENDEGNVNAEDALPQTRYLGVDQYYDSIGSHCSASAFGVEIFALVSDQNGDREMKRESHFGMSFLRLLSDRSGGCGPLISKLTSTEEHKKCGMKNDILMKEIYARCPWKRRIAFGSMLRFRFSPSLQMDSIDRTLKMNMFDGINKVYGSVAPTGSDDPVYKIGSCDNSNTLAFNLKITSRSGNVDHFVRVEGSSDYRLKPCIQTCFAYTSVVKNGGELVTVRRFRVATHKMELSEDVESITASLDSEALAVILFHKFHLYGLRKGIKSIENHANNWLLSTLSLCYESATKLQSQVKEYGRGVLKTKFFAGDRLTNVPGGQKSKKDILLAQGHDELQYLPLLVFSLIQCDALRPSKGEFNPSLDARVAAAANMSNMTPDVLARCIAPRLEFWVTGKTTPGAILESVNMSMDEVRYTIVDQIGTHEHDANEQYDGQMPLFLLDCPNNVLVYNCNELCKLRSTTEDDIPTALMGIVRETLDSYRVPPPSLNLLGKGNVTQQEAFDRFKDAMIEDSITSTNNDSYEEWRTRIAEILHANI